MPWPKLSTVRRPATGRALLVAVVIAAGTFPGMAQDPAAGPKTAFQDEREKASYAFGMNLALGCKRDGVELDSEALAQGMKDAQGRAGTRLTEEEMKQTLDKFTRELRLRQRQHLDQTAESNRQQGIAFLAENQKHAGVMTLPSGLQYKIMTEGAGQSPGVTNWVSLKFRGIRIDGTEFEKSYGYPQPNSYSLSNAIPAWREVLPRMKPGAEWELFVPANLAYGPDGSLTVGPNETVIFDLTLVSVLTGPAKDIRTAQAPDND